MVPFIIAGVLLILASLVAFANLAGTFQAISNRRQGIDKGYSNAPFISLLFSVIAYFVYPFEPKWWILLIPLADPSTWSIIVLPFFLLGENLRKRKV